MAKTYQNPSISKNVRTAEEAGDVTNNHFVFDFAQASYAPTALAAADRIQIGEVGTGEVLIPYLCRFAIPAFATSGNYTIGTDDNSTALQGSTSSAAATTLVGSAILTPGAVVGSEAQPTPIYLFAAGAIAGVVTTGKIVFDQITRPYDQTIDG
jgi:hypothetical protein